MNKKVYNKAFGKIFRTLGFLLVLASSVFIASVLILENETLPFIDKLIPLAQLADGNLANIPLIADYVGLGLVLGLILLLWTIRKGVILRVLLTVILLFGFIESSISGTSQLVPVTLASPSWLAGVLTLIEGLVDQITALSPYVIPGVAIVAPFLLWVLFNNKKPGRFSLFMLKLASTILFVAVILYVVANVAVTSLLTVSIYNTIQIMLYIVTYLFFIVGGLFGVLGFSRP